MTVPSVTCSDCGRVARCARTADGTVYRPFAWEYADEAKPLVGRCSACQVAAKVVASFRGSFDSFVDKKTK